MCAWVIYRYDISRYRPRYWRPKSSRELVEHVILPDVNSECMCYSYSASLLRKCALILAFLALNWTGTIRTHSHSYIISQCSLPLRKLILTRSALPWVFDVMVQGRPLAIWFSAFSFRSPAFSAPERLRCLLLWNQLNPTDGNAPITADWFTPHTVCAINLATAARGIDMEWIEHISIVCP